MKKTTLNFNMQLLNVAMLLFQTNVSAYEVSLGRPNPFQIINEEFANQARSNPTRSQETFGKLATILSISADKAQNLANAIQKTMYLTNPQMKDEDIKGTLKQLHPNASDRTISSMHQTINKARNTSNVEDLTKALLTVFGWVEVRK